MPELMKDRYYNSNTIQELALRVKAVCPAFPADDFAHDIMDETWVALELKARMRRITVNLGKHLPPDYEQALGILDKVIADYPVGIVDSGLLYFPDFVEVYGQDECHWDLSMAALERYTSYSTAEFAVRPFIINQEEKMMAQMADWAGHNNEHVRRLASEGCRPALPWGQALNSFKKDPSPVLRILETLKADPSLYVRKSVANNLNDISKTHSDLIAELAKDWFGKSKHTDWIVKHGCRTLLKKGNRDVLSIFGFADADCVRVDDFTLGAKSVCIGEDITFSFKIEAKRETKVRLEYGIDYVKANGTRSRKIFKISEPSLKNNDKKHYTKTHSFADVSSRKHYPGTHSLMLIVNGAEQGTLDFEVFTSYST
ncbi:DNA alkylation repair protein [Ohessyouella blattaphilus]|uniref:DNA alkylation repair protein n=1 Tax=Ohessyouella blattaphilus TaxID=2949333 RepID=A0ABT1EIZ3_9FIRM|nr:DNA alkylation repair protein [Ohessyouella blattaphilus]MCP1109737.1 DNA alkylation repair protein [Ohessyouella blattaphilus]MCR8563131.1 DNA alkylation repair protein [Ohessyouella blattaphilus]